MGSLPADLEQIRRIMLRPIRRNAALMIKKSSTEVVDNQIRDLARAGYSIHKDGKPVLPATHERE